MSLPLRPEVQALVRIRPVVEWFAHSFVPGPGCGLCARFYQAEPAPVVGTTKCPESLCLMLALPPSERRVPPLPRTLLLVHRSYGLKRPVWLSPTSAFGLVREVCAGCYQPLLLPGFSRRYLCKSVTGCLVPYPDGPTECTCLFLPRCHRPSQDSLGRLPVGIRERDFSAG